MQFQAEVEKKMLFRARAATSVCKTKNKLDSTICAVASASVLFTFSFWSSSLNFATLAAYIDSTGR